MDSPRTGFKKAAIASWALSALGVAGVVAASAVVYGETPAAPQTPSSQSVIPVADTPSPTTSAWQPSYEPAPVLSPGSGSPHSSSHGS
jgi:periplasmic protein TonB